MPRAPFGYHKYHAHPPDDRNPSLTQMMMLASGAALAALPSAAMRPYPAAFAASRASSLRAQLDESAEDDEYLSELENSLSGSSATGPRGSRLQRGLRFPRAVPAQRRKKRPTTPVRWTRDSTRLAKLPETIRDAYDDFLERPGQPLLLGSLALLIGFYLAGALSTVFGAKGFWEPTIALGPLAVGEAISKRYYSLPQEQRSQTIMLLNALKVGFMVGIVLDALKLAG